MPRVIDLCYGQVGRLLSVKADDEDPNMLTIKFRKPGLENFRPVVYNNVPVEAFIKINAVDERMPKEGLYVIARIGKRSCVADQCQIALGEMVDVIHESRERQEIKESLLRAKEREAMTRPTKELIEIAERLRALEKPKEEKHRPRTIG